MLRLYPFYSLTRRNEHISRPITRPILDSFDLYDPTVFLRTRTVCGSAPKNVLLGSEPVLKIFYRKTKTDILFYVL